MSLSVPDIRNRRRRLLQELLDCEAMEDAASSISNAKTEGIPDKLNLAFPNLALFESGGTTIGAARLSETKYQIVKALDFAGEFGLDQTDLFEMVVRWSDEEPDEGALKKTVSTINSDLELGGIPFQVKIVSLTSTAKQRKIIKKVLFLVASRS